MPEDYTLDRFDKIREGLWGLSGFLRRMSTVNTPPALLQPQGTWVIETIKTDDYLCIFVQCMDKNGGVRLMLPEAVANRIYQQHESIMKDRRKARAAKGVATRKSNKGGNE